MKNIITYGAFDLLHYGHINPLKRAKALVDYLIVALSTDEFNETKKIKNAISPMRKERHYLKPSAKSIS